MKKALLFACLGLILTFVRVKAADMNSDSIWAEKLGFPKGSRVVILHADDSGMCYEANQAVKNYLLKGQIQSSSAMVPCPWFNDMAEWAIENPQKDVGLHLTLTSEWKNYRWGGISDPLDISNLLDPDGYLWREVPDVVRRATPQEIEKEIRAQIDRSINMGFRPNHIDTHMGTLFAREDYAEVFYRIAMEYGIPANAIEFTPEKVEKFKSQGYPITDKMMAYSNNYTLPKLDDFFSVPEGETYEEKQANFFQLIESLEPGISEIIFHPSVETEGLKKITNSWQQRVWEAKMFSDEEVINFMAVQGIIFTDWKEIMKRYKESRH
ncbi:MAG: polysaccharide deacetylase family protein [Fidelibacterota bacterium]